MKAWSIVGIMVYLLSAYNSAAQDTIDYAPFRLIDESEHIIALNGIIDFRAPLAFRRILTARKDVKAIFLNSAGGSVQAALLIAEEIHERKIATIIPPGANCMSACAFIFLAGDARLATGSLGVHQISGGSDLKDAQLNLSDILETLDKYDVRQSVITRMLRTPPESMYVFSKQEVIDFGINRKEQEHRDTSRPDYKLGEEASSPTSLSPSNPAGKLELQEEAQKFILTLITASGSLPKSELLKVSNHIYGENVAFYGRQLTKREVLQDKAKYADRWPVRSSITRPGTVSTQCSEELCRVTGVYDWMVSDPKRNKSSRGSATFEYQIRMVEGSTIIISEDGKILDRNPAISKP